jgi:hypothetical protein
VPKLFIVEGGQESVFELLGDEVTIGRGASNAIQVMDDHASKHHAVVRTVAGRPKLVDLESKNGTRVNGQFRNQRWLEHGDTVSIGSAILRYDAADAPPAPAVGGRIAVRPVAAPAGAYAPAVPARAAAVAPPPVRAGAGAGRRARARDAEGDEDGEERRPPPRRGGNNAAVGMLVGGGVLAVIAVLFLLLTAEGNVNAVVAAEAKALAAKGDYRGAIEVLERKGDPTDEKGYQTVARLLASYKTQAAAKASEKTYYESEKVFRDQIEYPFIEQHKNKLPDEELARRIRDFLATYPGTPKAVDLERSPHPPFDKLRALMERVAAASAMR